MYTVECEGTVIFDDTTVVPANDSKVNLINPKLSMADNAAGTFDFTMPLTNQGYENIKPFSSIVTVKKDLKWLWAGRPLNISTNFTHQKTIKCEGVLSFLNDISVGYGSYKASNPNDILTKLLSIYNNRAKSNRKIYIGAVTMTASDGEFPKTYEFSHETVYEFIKKNLVDILGGHLFITYVNGSYKLNYYKNWVKSATQSIDFGVNLIEFTKNYDYTKVCTAIIPRGKQLDSEGTNRNKYLTIESVNNNSPYLTNSSAVNIYGLVEKVVDFSDVDDAQVLKESGIAYLNAYQFEDMVLDVRAVDLHMLNSSIESFDLLDEVYCVSLPHGMKRWFPVTKIDIPLDKPESIEYNLGTNVSTSLSSISAKVSSKVDSTLNDTPSRGSLLEEAFRNSNEILTAKTTGYVNITQQDDHSQALVISDRLPYTTASHYWQFNMNGLGYFVRQNDGTYKNQGIALTMNGAINADMITTGHMNADRIVAGSITVTQLANNSITAAKIKDGEISTSELANGAITETKIAAGAVTTGKIAANAVTAGKIAAYTITADQIAGNTITAAEIKSGTITANEIASNTITAAEIKSGTITADKIKAGTITADEIKAKTITASEIRNGSITGGSNGCIAGNTITDYNVNSISADSITAGTIDASRIRVTNLDADEITTGTISASRIKGGNLEMNVTNFTMNGYNTRNDSQIFMTDLEISISITEYSDTRLKLRWNWWWSTDTINFTNGVAVSNYYGSYSDYGDT